MPVKPVSTELKQCLLDLAASRAGEQRYRDMFLSSPAPLWAEDLSDVKRRLDDLRSAGVSDFSAYFSAHPELVRDLASRVKVLDVNPAALRFHRADSKEKLLAGLPKVFGEDSHTAFGEQLRRIAAGERRFDVEASVRALDGEKREVLLQWASGQECEHSLNRVYVSVIDITDRKRAESALRESGENLRAVVEQSLTGIYVISEESFIYVNPRMCEIFGYSQDELVGLPVPDLVAPADRDLVLENIRRRIAGDIRSIQYEFRGQRKDGTLIDIGVHGTATSIRGRPAIVGVLQDITERLTNEQRIKAHVHKLETSMLATVDSISRMLDLRDPYTSGHQRRVADIAAAIARDLGLDDHRVRGLEIAGRLHDIGKISIPAEILSKPTKLSSAELDIVKMHAAQGFEILKMVEFPWPVAQTVHQHHERMDGSGYPAGIRADTIVHEARILAVADVIEAMSSHRPYRASLGLDTALAEIERGSGKIYDADVSASALRLFRDKHYQIPA